jgi:hypothetical protein
VEVNKMKELTIPEVKGLKEYTMIYVEYPRNRYANGQEFIKIKDGACCTQNKWGTVNKVNEDCKYYV